MRHRLSVLPVLTVAAFFAGCAPTTPPATVISSPPPPAPAPAAPAAPAPAAPAPAAPAPAAPAPAAPAPAAPVRAAGTDELPAGVGREAVLKGCGGCHGIGQILTERRTRQEWADTTTMMITNGAPVSEAEFDLVVNYLAAHFGPK